MTDKTKAEKPTDFQGAKLEGAKFSKPYPEAYTPSPDAIVRAALETVEKMVRPEVEVKLPMKNGTLLWLLKTTADRIRALASDPAEVAAIIKKAEEDRG